MTLMVAMNALAPYSADSGPFTTSICSTASIGMYSGPMNARRSGRKLTGVPLIMILTSRVPPRRPGVTPRTAIDFTDPSSVRYRPGTLSSASATERKPFWRISLRLMTVTLAAARERSSLAPPLAVTTGIDSKSSSESLASSEGSPLGVASSVLAAVSLAAVGSAGASDGSLAPGGLAAGAAGDGAVVAPAGAGAAGTAAAGGAGAGSDAGGAGSGAGTGGVVCARAWLLYPSPTAPKASASTMREPSAFGDKDVRRCTSV